MSLTIQSPPGRQLIKASSFRSISQTSPFWFGNLVHLYLEISLGLDLEGAESIANARKAHEFIRKAADACFIAAEEFDGLVLEIHGRTLHVGLHYDLPSEVEAKIKGAAGLIHELLKRAYGSGGPSGWRMAADHDATLTITSVGIHDDTSLVSLSPAANYPAKQLARKAVARGELGAKIHGNWGCTNLEALSTLYRSNELARTRSLGGITLLEAVMEKRAQAVNVKNFSARQLITAQAAPLGTTPSDDLLSYYGYVLSMDLDGFTRRVAEAANSTSDDQRRLAEDFLAIMEEAANFAKEHPEWFIQFPFAGDNAIFAVTAKYLHDFTALKRVTPVEVAVEWEDRMGGRARAAGFGGWGQSAAAGDELHGNSKGNLHVAGIILGNRRFLVGIGPGMRYARQAFVQVDPSPRDVAMYRANVPELDERLKKEFEDCPSQFSESSSYFKMARLAGLKAALATVQAEQKRAIVTATPNSIQLRKTAVAHRPHLRTD